MEITFATNCGSVYNENEFNLRIDNLVDIRDVIDSQ